LAGLITHLKLIGPEFPEVMRPLGRRRRSFDLPDQ